MTNQCSVCGDRHEPWDAHDATSPDYHRAFREKHGRNPSWMDALAHCSPIIKLYWVLQLKEQGMWREPLVTPRSHEETPMTPILMYGEGFTHSGGMNR